MSCPYYPYVKKATPWLRLVPWPLLKWRRKFQELFADLDFKKTYGLGAVPRAQGRSGRKVGNTFARRNIEIMGRLVCFL